jgi:membrane protein required for beta-lactamase induction
MRRRAITVVAVLVLALLVGVLGSLADGMAVIALALFVTLCVYGTRSMRRYDRGVDRENERRYADSVRRGTDWL